MLLTPYAGLRFCVHKSSACQENWQVTYEHIKMLITSRQYVKGVRTNHPYSFCVSAGKTCFMEGTPWGTCDKAGVPNGFITFDTVSVECISSRHRHHGEGKGAVDHRSARQIPWYWWKSESCRCAWMGGVDEFLYAYRRGNRYEWGHLPIKKRTLSEQVSESLDSCLLTAPWAKWITLKSTAQISTLINTAARSWKVGWLLLWKTSLLYCDDSITWNRKQRSPYR